MVKVRTVRMLWVYSALATLLAASISSVAVDQLIHADMMAGRVHPGESNSSWIMRGLLELLTGPSPAAHALRDKYLFMVLNVVDSFLHATAFTACCFVEIAG